MHVYSISANFSKQLTAKNCFCFLARNAHKRDGCVSKVYCRQFQSVTKSNHETLKKRFRNKYLRFDKNGLTLCICCQTTA